MSDRQPPAPYWFYHEYLDEARRFRIHRVEADTEHDARRLHKQACEFRWVTHHVEPSVSSLYTKDQGTQRALVPGHRPDDAYHTQVAPTQMPPYLRQQLGNLKGALGETDL